MYLITNGANRTVSREHPTLSRPLGENPRIKEIVMSISKKVMIFFFIIMFGLVSNAFCRDRIVLGNFAEWLFTGEIIMS